MATTFLKAPEKSQRVSFGTSQFAVGENGLVEVPRFAVPELLNCGCTWPKGIGPFDINGRAELAGAEDHELSIYIMSRGISDHYWENNVHGYTERLRKLTEFLHTQSLPHDQMFTKHRWTDQKGQWQEEDRCFLTEIADELDEHYRKGLKHGRGRVVYFTREEKMKIALEIWDKEAEAANS